MIVHPDKNEIWLKIVYHGPGLAGKTTNLQYIYERTHPDHKGKMISLATETERTLFFDFVPQSLAPVNGKRLRFYLYTVPGPVFYDASRIRILKGVDGIVFVADSQVERCEANQESFENLEANLESHGRTIKQVPVVIQYNKRDLPNAGPLSELEARLNRRALPSFPAIARLGEGVFDTLKAIAKEVIARIPPEGTPYR